MVGSVDVAMSNQEDIRSGVNNTGAVYGGINLGNQSNIRNMPDWLTSRISTKPQATQVIDDPLNMVLIVSVLLIVGALVIKKVM